jgi:ADP-heptose:LPS heptosyltransferase
MDAPFPPGSPRRVAVFRALYLGDLLCSIPALNALDRRFPDAEITLISLPWARELAERLPAVDRFMEFAGYPGLAETPYDEGRTAAFLDSVCQRRFDLAIQLHGSGEITNELVARFGAGATIGFGPPGDRRLSAVLPWREDEHEIARWLRLVALLGGGSADSQIDVPIADGERRRVDRLLAAPGIGRGPLVGLHCGSKLESRRWPIERFAELGDNLARRHGARIVLTGGEGERHLAASMRALMHTEPVDLIGKTDLGAFLALVDRLDLLVTNDTGASHVAAATGTPSVVLFGPSRPSRWAPLDRARHAVIDARTVAGADLDDDGQLRRLPVELVLEACERLLGGPSARDIRFRAATMEHA